MTANMRERLIKIMEAWERDVRNDGMDAAFDRNTGCAGAGETLDAILAELRRPSAAMSAAVRRAELDDDGIDIDRIFTTMIDVVRGGATTNT
jgi:hypothetical protein